MPHRAPVAAPSAWVTSDVVADRSWEITLDDSQREAITSAVRHARAAGCAAATVGRETFPLPTLEHDLARWTHELSLGRGFLLLHRFPVDLLSADDTELAWVGLGTHLGRPIGQNKAGDHLVHIRDERLGPTAGKVRLYRTRERQDFHTDGADIIGLLCLHQIGRAHV